MGRGRAGNAARQADRAAAPLTASGVVLRGDVARGKEGFNLAIFIGYPWEL